MLSNAIALLCRIALIAACGVFAGGMVLVGVRFPAIGVLVLAAMTWRRLRRRHFSDSHGSATTASLPQIERGGLLERECLILGRCLPESPAKWAAMLGLLSLRVNSETASRRFLAAFFGKGWYADRMIRVSNAVHLATFAPAGAGKGVGVLVPNLLSYRGNCVITDPKGELFRLTAKHRRKKFGHRIIRIDPFGVCGPGADTLNPFDFIDSQADDFLDACRDLANMLVVRTGQEKDPHWNDSAELILTAFSAFTCGFEPDRQRRNLSTVRGMASSRHSYDAALAIMQQVDACQDVIRRLGGMLTWFTGEEQSSVLSTFQRHTAFLDSPAIARNIATSSFDPMILRKGKATLYLILPADRLASLAPLQRIWVGTVMRVITRGVPTEKTPVLWLLDEMAHIGAIRPIEDAVTLMRGMGMRLWFFFQSVEQLKTCFAEKAATVLDNIGTQQYFGISSYETADAISKRIGDATIGIRSRNTTSGNSRSTGSKDGSLSGNVSSSTSDTSSDIARRLLKPEEVLTLPDDITLIFHKNMPIITARLVKYFNAPEFRWRRSGRQRGLGLAAGLMATLTLASSLLFTGFAASLPPPQPNRRAPLAFPATGMRGYPARAGYGRIVPTPRRRSSRSSTLPGRSGFLIPIK